MKILHVNTNDVVGGAGRAAHRLHKAMFEQGIESGMLVLNKYSTDETVVKVGKSKLTRFIAIFKILIERLRLNKYKPFGTFSIAPAGFDITRIKAVREADVIYLHWINRGLLSVKGIEKLLKTGKPIYWYLHDMWAFTGGCHYSFECEKYKTRCESCNLIKENSSAKDISSKTFDKKRKHWGKYNNLHIVSPSTWLADCAKSSAMFKDLDVKVIPNTINSEYHPIERTESCRRFNLNPQTKYLLFAADSGANNPYKGWKYLENALGQMTDAVGVEAVVLASSLNQEIIDRIPMPVHCIGNLSDDYSLACLYSASDVFISPSLVDNFPNTIVESMACGTPVVGFDIGGIPDLIDHKTNGYLSRYKDVEDLRAGIEWTLAAELHSDTIRESVFKLVNPENIVKAHEGIWGK